jgi:hypothetical protein
VTIGAFGAVSSFRRTTPPTLLAVDDSYSVAAGAQNVVLDVLSNDVVAEPVVLQLVSLPSPSRGTVSLVGSPQTLVWSDTPGATTSGSVSFTYSITAGVGSPTPSSQAEVTIGIIAAEALTYLDRRPADRLWHGQGD